MPTDSAGSFGSRYLVRWSNTFKWKMAVIVELVTIWAILLITYHSLGKTWDQGSAPGPDVEDEAALGLVSAVS